MKKDENGSAGFVGFSSADSVVIIDDGPGDMTVRPSRPSLQQRAEAEREKIRRWGAKLGREGNNGIDA